MTFIKITLLLLASYVDMDTISQSWKENRACVSKLALKADDLRVRAVARL